MFQFHFFSWFYLCGYRYSFDKLENIEGKANNYSLPIATVSSLGGFLIGSGLIIDQNTGVLSLDENTVSITGEQTISGIKTFSNDLVINGNLIVNGNTETTTNTMIKDSFIELGNGVSSAINDSGIIIERGDTGDNAFMGWDESADKLTVNGGIQIIR